MARRGRPGRRAVHESAAAYDAVDPRARLQRILTLLTNNEVAQIIGVHPSQPGRWRSGRERVSSEFLSRVIDLDYAVSRILALWSPEAARHWLSGSDLYEGGARPIDTMILRGPMALVPTLDRIEAGVLG